MVEVPACTKCGDTTWFVTADYPHVAYVLSPKGKTREIEQEGFAFVCGECTAEADWEITDKLEDALHSAPWEPGFEEAA